jgi:DNA-binding GntR family transcriptional regulator
MVYCDCHLSKVSWYRKEQEGQEIMGKLAVKSGRAPGTRRIARHRVRNSIERMIVEGRFRPGEKLVQLQLSRQFGVSLGMVREALFELEGLGLVESFDNLGVRVRTLDAQMMHELRVIREVFDGVAARECCGKLTDADADELRQLAQQIYMLSMAGEYEEKNLLDRQFHLRIAELSGNRMLTALARQHQVLGKMWGGTTNAKDTLDGHLAIVDAILAGDADKAEQTARQHLSHVSFEMPITRKHPET